MTDEYKHLISYVDKIKELNYSTASALIVIHNDKIVVNHYNGRHSNVASSKKISQSSQFHVASARKSYLGLAVAYALYEGKIKSLDDYARDYFDEYDWDVLGDTTLRHLVTYSHGIDDNDGAIFREFGPGERWAYKGMGVIMMTKLINNLYKKPFTQLLKERVFEPLNFKETAWRTIEIDELVKVITDPSRDAILPINHSTSGLEGNLFVSTREFAYWGYLHLKKGFMNGKQIVPKEVIEIATKVQSPIYKDRTLPENGLFWYVQNGHTLKSEMGERVPVGSFQILGNTGPTILVIPKYNVVVAKMYNKKYNYGGDNYLHYLREFSNLVADTFAK
ncbi:penicillin-binding protein [Bacillus wiedmannii]|uniref:serine hydrolase domain-containing protein n=1 Tax=Bacillus cereus group TaxID=86661 RepID=UPI000BF6E685|nr:MULTISPECIES: serine hydrolase domain-containing protein [Bacillus cereus group]MDA2101923.1 serine hydrolase [Bacillus cereus]MDA2107522.1 serine hydrolase [Bacillus cereus]PFX51248.1 penicillin-binding protein [Bacillus wiedmannii]